MDNASFGQHLRSLRQQMGLTQAQLGQAAHMQQARISGVESGRRWITEHEAPRLAAALRIPVELLSAGTGPVVFPFCTPGFQALPPLLSKPEQPWSRRLNAARRWRPVLVAALLRRISSRADSVTVYRFLRGIECDSGPEAIFILQLFAAGALPKLVKLVRFGFRKPLVVDRVTGEWVGDVARPAILLETGSTVLLFCPQVTLRTQKGEFRADFLTLYCEGRCKSWLDIEVDGRGHQSEADLARQEALQLTEVRFDADEVVTPDFPDELQRRIRVALRRD